MDEKMNGGISTLRGIFCRLSFQKGGITAETIAAQGFDGGIFSVDTRHVGASFISFAPTFFKKSECTHSAAPPFQAANAPLVCGLMRWGFGLVHLFRQHSSSKHHLRMVLFCLPGNGKGAAGRLPLSAIYPQVRSRNRSAVRVCSAAPRGRISSLNTTCGLCIGLP